MMWWVYFKQVTPEIYIFSLFKSMGMCIVQELTDRCSGVAGVWDGGVAQPTVDSLSTVVCAKVDATTNKLTTIALPQKINKYGK